VLMQAVLMGLTTLLPGVPSRRPGPRISPSPFA
jgi:hypothetical protein